MLKILLIRLRLIGDVVFTTPLMRALQAGVTRTHASPISSNATRRRWSRGNPHLDELIVVAAHARLARRIADDLRWRAGCGGERFDLVLDLHGGPRSAWLTWATGARAADRLRHPGTALDVHAHRPPRRASCGRGTRCVNQWDLLEAIDGLDRRGTPDPDARRASRCRSTPARRPPDRRSGSRAAGVDAGTTS